ncbi:hypothetical protein HS7_00060 [Sulfolobales archaeon HS-7]|nr:hypothetical protein HS7_00060 [Sulfolobales archaeon HS-7]
MRYPITLSYNVITAFTAIASSFLFTSWWNLRIGSLLELRDSPFHLAIYLSGQYLTLSELLNLFLLAIALYVTALSSGYIYYTLKGRPKITGTLFWLTLLYLLDPIIVYLVGNYFTPIIASALGYKVNLSYPFFIFGNQKISLDTNILNINSISFNIYSYPTLYYFIFLTLQLLYIPSRIEIHVKARRSN